MYDAGAAVMLMEMTPDPGGACTETLQMDSPQDKRSPTTDEGWGVSAISMT